MTTIFCLFTFIIVVGFGGVQNAEEKYEGFTLWPQQTRMLQMKVLKATLNTEATEAEEREGEMSSEEIAESQTTPKPASGGEMDMRWNRMKRETKAEDVSFSASAESKQLDSDEVMKPSIKRQTTVTGNGNRLQNLINLPIQLDVLANVLSKLNTGVLDSKPTPATGNSISGDGNSISSLVNVPIDVDAVVNILSNVNTAAGSGSGSGQGGLVDGVLGGLLGGDGNSGGVLGGLLGNDNNGALTGLLGNTLGDLLGALLGGDGVLGNLLGGRDGRGLLGDLLNNLLDNVVKLVDNLLELLVGLLDALLLGMDGKDMISGSGGGNQTAGGQNGTTPNINIQGNNNNVNTLINAPIRINALVNVLSSLKQQLQQAMQPSAIAGPSTSGNGGSLLENIPGSLPSSSQGLLGPIQGSSGGLGPAAGSTSISGNNNAVSSLLNVAPDIDLNLNVLSRVTDILTGANSGGPRGGIFPGSHPNEICFDIPLSPTNTAVRGNNNTISNAINVQPRINLDLNVLSSVNQTSQSNAPTQRVCITLPHKSTTGTPTTHSTLPSLPHPTTVPTTPSPPGEICFYVWVDQSGTVVQGNNNRANSLLNLPINLNLDLNVLSRVQQTNTDSQPNLVMRRICIPGVPQPTRSPIHTTTDRSRQPCGDARCFRRTCAKWRHVADDNYANNHNEYPKYTVTQDLF